MAKSPFFWLAMLIGVVGGGLQINANLNQWGGDIWRFGGAGIESINEGNLDAPRYNPDTGALESQ